MVLHATPRPPLDDAKRTPSGRGVEEKQRRLELLVYHRMLLFVWRRSKKRLAMISESLRRRQDQIKNLEKQVNCLKDLTQSECHKRGEAMGDYQRMDSVLQTIRTENSALIAAKVVLQNELDELRNKLQSSTIEMENMKNEINTKNIYMKRLENEIYNNRNELKIIKEENVMLGDKVKAQDEEIKAREEIKDGFQQAVRNLEKRLEECECEKKAQFVKLNKLVEQYKVKVKSFDGLRQELIRVCAVKDELSCKVESLENELAKATLGNEVMYEENQNLKMMVEKTRWWANTKEFVLVSWAVLRHAMYLMLPAV